MAMSCREYREGHPAETAEGRAHAAGCAECRAFAASWDLLRDYRPIAPGPGFYGAVRRKLSPRILRFAAPLAAVAAAVLVSVVLFTNPAVVPPPVPDATAVERELVENLELLENYELLKTLEVVGETASPLLENGHK
jgi:hypothetical protein